MLDLKYIREHPEEVSDRLASRDADYIQVIERLLSLDSTQRELKTELDELRKQRNELSRQIGKLMKQGDVQAAQESKQVVAEVNERIEIALAEFKAVDSQCQHLLAELPNLPDISVPVGGEESRELVKEWGEPPRFDFQPRDHVQLARELNLVDFPAAARVTGSGFQFFVGQGAVMQRALINLMLEVHVSRHGYVEMRPPFMVKESSAFSTGQLPKFSEEMYHVFVPLSQTGYGSTVQPHYYLIPTAEVPVCNYFREQILEQPNFPLKFVAYSPCWRVEAGHYGKEARGLMRVHQFEKVELVNICAPEQSAGSLETITEEAEHILELLQLPYRRALLPSGDMGFAAAKTYDLEVYAAAMDEWLEVSSASNTLDFQARRAGIRFRREPGAKPEFVHMLNASGVALPRLLIALLENYQLENGNVRIPQALLKYFGGIKYLSPPENPIPFFD